MVPYFTTSDGDRIQMAHDGHGVWVGNSVAVIKHFPRTIGGIIKPSNIIEKRVTVKCYLVPPEDTTRTRLERYMNQLNEELAKSPGTLEVSGNSYPDSYPNSATYDMKITSDFVTFSIDFIIGDQDNNGVITQKSTPDLYDFSRGRKLFFSTELLDGTSRNFNFWHNADSVRDLNMNVVIKNSGRDGNEGKIIKNGGMENIRCSCWFRTFSRITRQTIEAYMFNMINGPLGRIGTLTFESPEQSTWNHCFLQNVTMHDLLFQGATYELTFLSPLQCN